ncbi:uncharacterized protein LOC114165322 [Vigna unguiculata]|uniref:Uncharacterized protein n=1 Tax=Vigna unguiculata TaxID=3917 RepID=A0A4D6MBI2_VIGUN|nr:uncharacterized protein LOC114165322 [Vigna unguiculata]QCD98100.1 hypothetical protein DEO72_LG6g2816 [Vigna unguiculata]
MPDSTTAVTTIHLPTESSALRRHNSIAAASPVTKLSLPATTPPQRTTSLELVSLKSPFSASYTSLRDVLPSPNFAVNSPTASAYSGQEISIRNRLVKQAAWAYLQPMSASPGGASTPHFLRRLSAASLDFIFHHLVPAVSRFFRGMFHAIRVHVCTRCYS